MMDVVSHAPYLAVYVAAILEGEAVFAMASVLVAAGKLHALGVVVCGALGAATGDQFYFYLFRGALGRWIKPADHHDSPTGLRVARIRATVERHQSLAAFVLRFAPGFRIALAAACAWAHQSPIRFSVINVISAFIWAGSLLTLIAWAGPSAAHAVGINARWAAGVVAVLLVVMTWRLARLAAQPTRPTHPTSPTL